MFSGAISQHGEELAGPPFTDLGLDADIVAALDAIGFERCTPIQDKVIPDALTGVDVIGLAQTGSGKTAAFVLPMLQRLGEGGGGIRGLIVCPTREIALQTEAFLEALQLDRRLRVACLIGGVRLGPQFDALRKGVDVVVATPGRLLDHVGRRTASLEQVEILVLDEADHMLDLGFLPQIRDILETVPDERQTMMFSATMPTEVERLARQFMRDPVRVDIMPKGAAEGIEHRLYLVEYGDKKPCLLALAEQEPGAMLIFVRRKVDADWASRQLQLEGHPVSRIHSDRSQKERVEALSGLRQGEHRILVATDIAARGIDIPIIEHIVNFDVPETVEDYIHRAGRTARGTSGGIVSTIATWIQKEMIQRIETALGEPLPRCTAPGVEPYVEQRTTIKGRQKIRRRLR